MGDIVGDQRLAKAPASIGRNQHEVLNTTPASHSSDRPDIIGYVKREYCEVSTQPNIGLSTA